MQTSTKRADLGGRGAASAQALLRLALTSGDERLGLSPDTGRNRYGVPPGLPENEIWFASSTASPVSRRGYAAAATAMDRLFDASSRRLVDWPEEIRARIQEAVGLPGSSVVLAGSGTEAELIVAAVARHLLPHAVTNVVLAPGETGSGVMLAAAGRHFLNSASCAPSVARGTLLAGLAPDSILAQGIEIRAPDGAPLDAATVDADVRSHVMGAIAAGRDVLVHCLATSKTGLSGLRRSTAAALRSALGDRCLIVVDACQLRCSAAQIRQDLAAGFLVVISGSKFIGGPPFSAAILVPPELQRRLADLALPAGLSAYSAYHDWPASLRDGHASSHSTSFNLPLYVRWEAALIELERYQSIASARRAAIVRRFADAVERVVGQADTLRLIAPPVADAAQDPRTIFPLIVTAPDGTGVDVHAIYRSLSARGFHVGQPVAVGSAEALRICLSAPQISDVAASEAAGASPDMAMRPLLQDLDALVAVLDATVRS